MDEQQKHRIRERARILHWVTELVLLFLVVIVVIDWGWRKIIYDHNYHLIRQLSHVSTQVLNEFTRFYFGRGEQLFAYPPPENCRDREAWAQKIIADFDQPAAVFVRDCCGLSWITRPPEMAPGIERLERALAQGIEKPDAVTRHVSGQMITWRFSTLTDTTGTSAIMVGPESDSLRWGIVIRFWDTYRAFLKNLNDPQTKVGPRHPAFALQKTILLPSDPQTNDLPRMRASLNGELLFASPKLDTTSYRYVFEHKGLRQEIYATRQAEGQALVIERPYMSWLFLTALALLMLVVHFYWLWIKKLTAPVV